MALLVKIGAELTDFKKQLKTATKDVNEVGKTISNVGGTLTKAFTIPVLGIAAAAIKVGSDFDTSMSEVSAISGATGKDLDILRDKAKEMGSTTKFSASESADAMKYMAMAGWNSQQMVSGLPGILNLAAASGEDLATTSDIVTDALTAFGLKADDSGHFADVLAKTASSANTNVSLMGETFKYVAPLAGTLGFNVEDTSLAIGLMANAGIKGSQAGTALKTAFANLASPTAAMKKEMERLNISLINADGTTKTLNQVIKDMRKSFKGMTKAEQAAAASTIFGKEAMSGMLAVINASDDDFNSLETSIYGADGAALKMSETMQDNLQGDLTTLGSGLEGAGIKIQEKLEPALRGIVGTLTDAVSWFNNLDEGALSNIVMVGGLVAALGPLLIILGQSIIWFGKVKEAMGILQMAGGPLSGAFGSVGAAIGSLAIPIAIGVAAIILLWNTSEEFRIAVGEIFSGIKEIFQGLIDFVTGIFTGDWDLAFSGLGTILSGFRTLLFGVIDSIQAAFNSFSEWLGKVFTTDWSKYFGGFGDVLNGFFASVSNVWGGIKNIFNGIITFVKGTFTGNWKSAWSGVVKAFGGVFQSIGGLFSAPFNGVIGLINSAIGALNKISVDIPDWVPAVGGKKFGFNLKKIPYLAKGGDVFSGSAIFGEAGPEMLTVSAGVARVTPLSGNSSGNSDFIDYERMAAVFVQSMEYLRLYIDGKELADATFYYTKDNIEQMEKFNNFLKGVR